MSAIFVGAFMHMSEIAKHCRSDRGGKPSGTANQPHRIDAENAYQSEIGTIRAIGSALGACLLTPVIVLALGWAIKNWWMP